MKIVPIIAALILLGCSGKVKDSEGIQQEGRLPFPATIDLVKGLENSGAVYKLSDVADSIKFIILENTEKSLFMSIDQIEIDGQDMIISSSQGQSESYFFHFNLEGKLLNSVGTIGRGPSEYTNSSVALDTQKKRAVILRWYNGDDFIAFDYNGAFLGKLTLNPIRQAFRFYFISGGRIVVYNYSQTPPWPVPVESSLFELYDSTGILLDRIPSPLLRIKPETEKTRLRTPAFVSFPGVFKNGNEVFLYSQWEDTIYTIEGDEIKPAFILNKGKYSAPLIERYRETYKDHLPYMGEYLGDHLLITDSLVFIEQHIGEVKIVFEYNRYSGLTRSSQASPSGRHEWGYLEYPEQPWFIDDLSGSNSRIYVNRKTGDDVTIAYICLSPSYFREYYGQELKLDGFSYNPAMRENRLKVLRELKDDDNPVVILVYMKK